MPPRPALPLLALLALAGPAPAAVVVVANYTPAEVTFTLAEPGAKPRTHKLPAYHVLPFAVGGPADITAPAGGKTPLRVDPYHAYVFLPAPAGVRVELIDMPGKMPERDARAELNPPPRTPVKIPVTLYTDDEEPRADKVWQEEVRARFDAAAAVLREQTGFSLEFAGYGTWNSDPKAKQPEPQLAAFEAAVRAKPRTLAVGFLSRKLDDGKDAPFGACRGRGATHVLVREWRPKGEPERLEVLVRYLAVALGAVPSPDTGSVMRPRLGDGQALAAQFVVRLDPLNVLALNLWADQWRAGIHESLLLPDVDRTRLARVYNALAQAAPDDPLAADYVRDLAKGEPKADPGAKPPASPDRARRVEAVRAVVRAVTERAKANHGPAALTRDALTVELLRAAAAAAQKADEPDRATAFLLGVGIALDDRDTLLNDPATSAAVREVETAEERTERLGVLGNPTLRNRRDLCRRFAVGCGAGDVLVPSVAEYAAVRAQEAELKRTGFGFPALAAEFAGLSFARRLQSDPKLLDRVRDRFAAADYVPSPDGLRDGLGPDTFKALFGDTTDERFAAALRGVRDRVRELPAVRTDP